MLHVSVHKDIGEYKPKYIAGLSSRTIIFGVVGILVAALLYVYFNWVIYFYNDFTALLIMVSVLPFWAAGYLMPYGMRAEEFVKHYVLYKLDAPRVFFISSTHHIKSQVELETDEYLTKLMKRPDIEAISPSEIWGIDETA